jgi:hypothetical protein
MDVSGNGNQKRGIVSGFPENQVSYMYPFDNLDADVLSRIRFPDGNMIEFHRGHGLVDILMRSVDVDPVALFQVFVEDDCGDTHFGVIMGYPSNHGLHAFSSQYMTDIRSGR